MKLLSLLLVAAVWAAKPSRGEAPAPAKPPLWNTTTECQMIVLPQKAVLPLLPELLDETTIDAAFAKLQELIATGTAQLAANLIARSNGDDTAKAARAESVEELRYATEFDPPKLPQNAGADPEVLKHWPLVGITPVGFETRNVGASVEVDVYPNATGNLLNVRMDLQHVRFLRWAKSDAGKLANGDHLSVEQPIFHVTKNTSRLFMKNGQRALVGVHKLPEPADTWELFVIRVSATRAKQP